MERLQIKSVAGGINTDKAPEDIAPNECLLCLNIDPRYDKIKKLLGADDVFDSLPTNLDDAKSAAQFLFTKPSEQQVTILYGQDSSDEDRLWIRPYPDGGSWTDSWLELTEHEGVNTALLTADAETSTTTIVDAALSSSEDDYYNGWIVVNTTRDISSVVSDYDGGTKTITLEWSIASQTTGDSYVICRFPTLSSIGALRFIPGSDVRFRGRENAIEVYCGRDGNILDFMLQYFDRGYFDHSNLNHDGFWFSANDLLPLNGEEKTLSAVAEVTDSVTPDDYIVMTILLYDNYQEGPLLAGEGGLQIFGNNPVNNGTTYAFANHGITVGDNEKIQIALDIDPRGTNVLSGTDKMPLPSQIYFDKRITHLLFYVATAEDVDGTDYRITEAFRLCKIIDIDDTDWSGTGSYTLTTTILGSDYINADGITLEVRQGHSNIGPSANFTKASEVSASAEFSAFVGDSLFVASIYIDEKRPDFIIKTPINSDLVNTPDVRPWGEYIDTSIYGIPRIIGLYEVLKQAVVIGENRILRIASSATQTLVEETFVERGGIAKKGIVSAGGVIYLAGQNNIYSFTSFGSFGQRGAILRGLCDRETQNGPKGGILGQWLSFSDAQRAACVAGYDRNLNVVVFSISTTIFVYWITLDCWTTYAGVHASEVPAWFYTDFDGNLIAVTASSVKQLFSSDPDVTNAMRYISPTVRGPLRSKRVRPVISNSDVLSFDLYDTTKSTTVPRTAPVKYQPAGSATTFGEKSKEMSGKFDALRLELNTDSSLNSNEIVSVYIDLELTSKR